MQAASIQLENNYNILLNTHIYIYMSVNIVYDVTIVVACMRFVDIIATTLHSARHDETNCAIMKPSERALIEDNAANVNRNASAAGANQRACKRLQIEI